MKKLFLKIFFFFWNLWFSWPEKIRFLLVGGFNATVSYAIYAIFLYFLGMEQYWFSMTMSWILSSFSSFATQKIFVFQTKGNFSVWLQEYTKCIGVWIVAYIINTIMLELFAGQMQINAYIAQIIAIACTTISSYILFKFFAFKH